MKAPTHLLVANPTAQSGRNAARIDRALAELRASGLHARLLPTDPGGRTSRAVGEALAREPLRCVVAMGGDGTFREVAEGLLDSGRADEVALGMLPAGTANNHGRAFGLRAGDAALAGNARIVAAGRETRLDAGRLHLVDAAGATVWRGAFFDSVGWGIGAAVIAARNSERGGALGSIARDKLLYGAALLRALASARPGGADVVASISVNRGPSQERRLAELLIRGTRVYAGGWVVDPAARHDDGAFEVFSFPSRAGWVARAAAGLSLGPLVLAGLVAPAAPPDTQRASFVEVELRVAPGGATPACQLDGEEMPPCARASIEVVPRALRVIVPAAFADR